MNQRHKYAIAFGIVALATGAAKAQDAEPDTWLAAAKSTLTRAEVQAEAIAARAAAATVYRPIELTFMEQPMTRTRAEVVAELMAAKASGEYDAINAEVTPFPAAPARAALYAGAKQ